MKFVLAIFLMAAVGCAHQPASQDQRTPAQSQIATPKPEELTIWSLKELAQQKKFDVLNELFNNKGIQLQRLPQGYAAGAATRVMDMDGVGGKGLELITGKSWRGKIFFPSANPRKSRGLNRIRQGLLLSNGIVPMASFVTELLDRDPLTPEAKFNLVNLNYSNPVTKGEYWQEKVLLYNTQVYDLMVPVQGKYGPVFIGKTWLGKYDADGKFTATYPDHLIAWFFLDFNEEALKVQKAQYWDGSKETVLNPLPKVVD